MLRRVPQRGSYQRARDLVQRRRRRDAAGRVHCHDGYRQVTRVSVEETTTMATENGRRRRQRTTRVGRVHVPGEVGSVEAVHPGESIPRLPDAGDFQVQTGSRAVRYDRSLRQE